MSADTLYPRLDRYRATIASHPQDWADKIRSWSTFAAVTGSAIAMASSASAGTVYSGPLNQVDRINASATASHPFTDKALTVQVDGAKFTLSAFQSLRAGGTRWAGASLGNWNHAGIGMVVNASNSLKKLASGAAISNGNMFFNGGGGGFPSLRISNTKGTLYGTWHDAAIGFAGVAFNGPDSQTHYGWLRLEVLEGDNGSVGGIELIDFAYNDVAGEAIAAGDGIPATPEPGTAALSLLAFGAAGITALRRRRANQPAA